MSRHSQALRLHRLIEARLGPYTGSGIVALSREDEKKLLIALSQVLREVQLWSREVDCSSDDETDAKSAANSENSDDFGLQFGECRYLCDIVCDMMVLLNKENQHVQHVAGNLLLAISDFVSVSESNWRLFIYLLFVCTKFSISNILSRSSTPGREDSRCKLHSYVLYRKPWLRNASWLALVQITRVLRYIWKTLKREDNEEFVQAFLDSLNSFISDIPMHSFDEYFVGQNGDHRISCGPDTKHGQRPELVFLGYLVQLLCSVIEQIVPEEVQSGSLDRHPILYNIVELVPKLFYWCLCSHEDHAKTCLLMYFRHKLLMLMIRLSESTDFQCSNLNSWLQLLHSYFEGFLCHPADRVETLCNNSLEGSPFTPVVPDGAMRALNIAHIQRQATYLFLRCSFSLIGVEREIGKKCHCLPPKMGLNSVVECCCHNKGLMELDRWLRKNIATKNLYCSKLYAGNCTSFASSLVQLYMLEDDLLFKVLLQMLNLPLHRAQLSHEEGKIPNSEEDLLFHVGNFFNPITIFHVFLAEIHYDHQLLLDYLISKDAGVSCAQYLLRCLRIIYDKFQAFLQFQFSSVEEEPPPKKRKSLSQGTSVLGDLSSSSSLEKNTGGDHINVYKKQKISQPFEEAKSCLLSLKDSLRSLHEKNLFPYNPTTLLKRLTEFQELCYKQ